MCEEIRFGIAKSLVGTGDGSHETSELRWCEESVHIFTGAPSGEIYSIIFHVPVSDAFCMREYLCY